MFEITPTLPDSPVDIGRVYSGHLHVEATMS